jgi:hypothetical protein
MKKEFDPKKAAWWVQLGLQLSVTDWFLQPVIENAKSFGGKETPMMAQRRGVL